MIKVTMSKTLPLSLIVLFVGVILSGIFIPVYSDEAVIKWTASRFFLEDGHLVSLFPQCSTMANRTVSWVFYPAAILISALYADLGPLGIRLSGIIFSSAWFALLALWCFKQTVDVTSAVRRFAGFLAIAALGVVPYLFVLSRSEHFIILPILILCITALCFKGWKSLAVQSTGAVLFALLVSCFFYGHPKSLFFLPFIIVALWLATEGYYKAFRFALLAYAIGLFSRVLLESIAIGACTDAPAIQSMLAANTLLPSMLFSAPNEFIDAALSNMAFFPDRLLSHLTFNATFQSGWLPPLGDSTSLLVLNIGIRAVLYAFVVGSHLAALGFLLSEVVQRRVTAPILLAASLASTNIANVLFFNLQNFYAGTQFVPIAITLAALIMHSTPVPKLHGMVARAYPALLVFSALSMATLLSLVTPLVMENSSSQKAVLPGQPLSIPVFDVQSHLDSIKSLAASCGLSTTTTSEYLVLDHMTYFAFLSQKKPIHVLYVSEMGYGGDLTNGRLLPFLKRIGSPGIISRCEWMPNEFKSKMESDEMGYCCTNLNYF